MRSFIRINSKINPQNKPRTHCTPHHHQWPPCCHTLAKCQLHFYFLPLAFFAAFRAARLLASASNSSSTFFVSSSGCLSVLKYDGISKPVTRLVPLGNSKTVH